MSKIRLRRYRTSLSAKKRKRNARLFVRRSVESSCESRLQLRLSTILRYYSWMGCFHVCICSYCTRVCIRFLSPFLYFSNALPMKDRKKITTRTLHAYTFGKGRLGENYLYILSRRKRSARPFLSRCRNINHKTLETLRTRFSWGIYVYLQNITNTSIHINASSILIWRMNILHIKDLR